MNQCLLKTHGFSTGSWALHITKGEKEESRFFLPLQLIDSSLRTRKMVSGVLPRAAASCLQAPCTLILLKVGLSAPTQALITASISPWQAPLHRLTKNNLCCLPVLITFPLVISWDAASVGSTGNNKEHISKHKR